jgi:PHP family Zn ribbon phosphoesterase
MTPNNIVNMALLNGLDAIAITDHNTCGNVRAVAEAAAETGLMFVPGMELETSEEVHVICLLPDLDTAERFSAHVDNCLPNIKNKPEIFGRQILFNSRDEEAGEHGKLLITATSIDLYTLVKLARDYGGVPIPAHVDRSSYSIISNLGFVPWDLDIQRVEFSKYAEPEKYMADHAGAFQKKLKYLRSSDAHYLKDIAERENFLDLEGPVNARSIIMMLRE